METAEQRVEAKVLQVHKKLLIIMMLNCKNPFVREGFRFKGWSTSKTSSAVKYTDQATDRNIPLDGLNQALNNDIPQKYYSLCSVGTYNNKRRCSKIQRYPMVGRQSLGAAAANVFVKNSNQGYNAYELIRYYLDIDMKDFNIPVEQLDKSKFYVVWERSTDGGSNYQKIPLDQYQSFSQHHLVMHRELQ